MGGTKADAGVPLVRREEADRVRVGDGSLVKVVPANEGRGGIPRFVDLQRVDPFAQISSHVKVPVGANIVGIGFGKKHMKVGRIRDILWVGVTSEINMGVLRLNSPRIGEGFLSGGS